MEFRSGNATANTSPLGSNATKGDPPEALLLPVPEISIRPTGDELLFQSHKSTASSTEALRNESETGLSASEETRLR